MQSDSLHPLWIWGGFPEFPAAGIARLQVPFFIFWSSSILGRGTSSPIIIRGLPFSFRTIYSTPIAVVLARCVGIILPTIIRCVGIFGLFGLFGFLKNQRHLTTRTSIFGDPGWTATTKE